MEDQITVFLNGVDWSYVILCNVLTYGVISSIKNYNTCNAADRKDFKLDSWSKRSISFLVAGLIAWYWVKFREVQDSIVLTSFCVQFGAWDFLGKWIEGTFNKVFNTSVDNTSEESNNDTTEGESLSS